MTDLTELDGGAAFTATEEEIEAALAAAADELGQDPDEIAEEVAYILDAGTGMSTNEGVGGVAMGANEDAADDPRLEALEVYKLNEEI